MEHRTRVERAIKHLPVDQVPCAELVINDALVQAMFKQEPVRFDHRLEFIHTLGLDAVCLQPNCQHAAGGTPRTQDIVFADVTHWVNTDLFTFAILDGPVGWGTKLLGFEQVMMQMTRNAPDFCDLLAAVERMNKELISRLAGSGVNGIILADDIAFTQGLMIRPAVLREIVFPSLASQAAFARQLGLPVFFHSDGNLTLVLDDIVAAGFDGLQCIEALAGMDMAAVKQQYGDKLCLWGNLDPAELIQPRSLSQLEQTVTQIVRAAGHDGGLIFGTSSGLFEDMRLDSLKAVYEIVRQRKA